MSEIILGIDLGTTYSCVAIVEENLPRVLEQKGGLRTLPSVVAFNADASVMVGSIAKRQSITNPENTVSCAKRLIGRTFEAPEVQKAAQMVSYKITQGPNRDPRIQIHGKNYPIAEISAFLLKQIKSIAEEALHITVEKAVITVPAYFSDGQRQATKDAGKMAGLDVIRIVNEPTAAAIAFGFKKKLDKKVAVYDLGGGTFDISVLDISSDTFEVLATGGDTFLGGEDFDQQLMQFIANQFKRENPEVDLFGDRMALQRLKDAAETAKCQLSELQETEVNLPFISTVNGESKHIKTLIRRVDLETLTEDLVNRTISICRSVLDMAALKVTEIDDVILVGGMTRMPLVQKRVQEFFKRAPAKNVHPDEAVAIGAAILGVSLTEARSDILLLDVTPMSLGIRTAGGFYSALIPKNSTVPTEETHIFTTVTDGQRAVKIQVLQGDSKNAGENTLLGEFTLTDIPSLPAGEPEIAVTFAIDANGIVQVSARDLKTEKEQSIVVTASSSLSEIEKTEITQKFQNLPDDVIASKS